MTVTAQLQRLYASAPDDVVALETLEIRHSRFSQTYWVTNNPLPFTATIETALVVDFTPLPFGVRLPGANPGGTQDLQVVIDNVDRVIIEELERASADPSERIALTFRVFASDDLTAPGSDPIALSISDISANFTTIEATASRTDVLNKRFPAVLYDVVQFPGLDR